MAYCKRCKISVSTLNYFDNPRQCLDIFWWFTYTTGRWNGSCSSSILWRWCSLHRNKCCKRSDLHSNLRALELRQRLLNHKSNCWYYPSGHTCVWLMYCSDSSRCNKLQVYIGLHGKIWSRALCSTNTRNYIQIRKSWLPVEWCTSHWSKSRSDFSTNGLN